MEKKKLSQRLLRNYKNNLELLIDSDIWDIEKGKVIINFNNNQILEVRKEVVSYRKNLTTKRKKNKI